MAEHKGQFKKGNTIGQETRFKQGNDIAEKYQDEFADKLLEFFSKPISRVEYIRKYNNSGVIIEERPIEFTDDFPTMGMFARSIGVSVSAIKLWAGVTKGGEYAHPRFALAYAKVKDWAEGMIESGALSGKLDSNMAKFVLTNDYGKQDKQVVENNIKGLDDKDMELIRRVEARLNGGEEC